MLAEPKSPPGTDVVTRVAVAALLAFTLALPVAAQTAGAAGCGDLANGSNGPFDYRNQRRDLRALAEANHFTPEVETLIRGKSSHVIGSDIHFVLAAFPNHPRALMAMMRLGEKQRTPVPPGAAYSVECYFERAVRFRPDDNVARMTYAMFLSRSARAPEALQQLDRVVGTAGDNAFTHFNTGVLYFEMKQYDKALAQAHAAMAQGLPRTELREQLKSVGKWTEPPDAGSAVAAASPASAASAP